MQKMTTTAIQLCASALLLLISLNTYAGGEVQPTASPGHPSTSTANKTVTATIISITDKPLKIVASEKGKAGSNELTLSDDIKNKIQNKELVLGENYEVDLGFDDKSTITSIQIKKSGPISGQKRWGYLIVSALSLLAFTVIALMLSGQAGLFCFRDLLIGEDNRYSNSKFQIALWFFILISTYSAVVLLRWNIAGGEFLLVNIPTNLLLLSGMSVLTFGGAKAITASKSDADATLSAVEATQKADDLSKAADSALQVAAEKSALAERTKTDDDQRAADEAHAKASAAKSAADDAQIDAAAKAKKDGYNMGKPAFFRDLLQNDHGKVDIGDFQMLVITTLAVVVYLLQIDTFMQHVDFVTPVTLPDLDNTILSVFGLGHGAYLTKKYAGKVGAS